MIRVKEFADKVGCSPQNIYLHLKNYAAELEGHTEKGRRGILLDEYACEFIRGVMYPKEISADNEVMEEVNRLRAQLLQMGMENAHLAAKLASVEGERDRAMLEAGQYQKALTASTQELEDAQQAAQQAAEDAENLRERLAAEEAVRAEAESQIAALKGRNIWQRLTRKGE